MIDKIIEVNKMNEEQLRISLVAHMGRVAEAREIIENAKTEIGKLCYENGLLNSNLTRANRDIENLKAVNKCLENQVKNNSYWEGVDK